MEAINVQAARWAVRTDHGSLEPNEQEEFEAWLAADPRHLGAYVRARARWVDLDRLAALNGPKGAVTLKVEAQRSITRRTLLAASLAMVSVAGGGSWFLLRRGQGGYTSGIGEVRRIALEDGSTLLLNTASEVTVDFSKTQRSIRLVRGEALFKVAHDEARPFVVAANDTAVRAVGTAFAVRLGPAQVEVTVTEGVVEVGYPSGVPARGMATPTKYRVSANHRVVISRTDTGVVRPVASAETDRQLAWRAGFVSFDGESLQTAVAEINRHNRRKIVIDDPALAAKPIVGVFRATDLDGFAAAAATALKARAISDGNVVRLEPALAH